MFQNELVFLGCYSKLLGRQPSWIALSSNPKISRSALSILYLMLLALAECVWLPSTIREYAPLPRRMGFRLLPLVATTFGSWHPETLRFLRECAQRVGTANASLPGAARLPGAVLSSWLCRLSIALQRENAAMAKRCAAVDGDFGLDRPWSEGPPLLWEQTCMSCACGDSDLSDEEPGNDQ